MSRQLVTPNPSVTDGAGWCLRFTQTVWGAPARYESAWEAWEATQYKHGTTENIPNDIAVIVWFSHYGDYDHDGKRENWGHVVTWFPGRGYLSSPGEGVGQEWLDTIQGVEQRFNSNYVGWSEDINGLRVAEITAPPPPVIVRNGTRDMIIVRDPSRNRAYALGQQYLHAYKFVNYGEVVAKGINPSGKFIDLRKEDATVDCYLEGFNVPYSVFASLAPGGTYNA